MSPDTRQVFSWRTQILRDLMADIDAWRGHRIELLAMIEMAHAEANALRGLSFSDTNSDAKNTDGTKGKLTRIIHDPLRLVDFLPPFSAEINS